MPFIHCSVVQPLFGTLDVLVCWPRLSTFFTSYPPIWIRITTRLLMVDTKSCFPFCIRSRLKWEAVLNLHVRTKARSNLALGMVFRGAFPWRVSQSLRCTLPRDWIQLKDRLYIVEVSVSGCMSCLSFCRKIRRHLQVC